MLTVNGWYEEVHAGALGEVVWERWPDAAPIFKPVYDQARREGFAYKVVEYRGLLVEIHCTSVDNLLHVCLQQWTLEGLREALDRLDGVLTASAA